MRDSGQGERHRSFPDLEPGATAGDSRRARRRITGGMTRFLVLVTTIVLFVTACGAGASPAPRLTNAAAHTHPSLHAVATARRREAGRKAQKLLQRVVLPPGTRRIGGPAVLAQRDTGVSILHETAWRFAFRRVQMPLESVFAFEKSHPPVGFEYIGGGGLYRSLDFSSGGMGVNQRLLTVDLARLAGRTVLRLEAGVAWIDPRSPREVVPAGVREIDIRDGRVKRGVKKPDNIARIVRWFDELNIAPRIGVFDCPYISTRTVRFAFRSGRGAELASAVAGTSPATGCSPIQFTIGGKRQTPLVDATFGRRAFVNRVERLLGLRFPRR